MNLRQGSILSKELSQQVLGRKLGSDEVLVLISHDCDLSNDSDLEAEYITGTCCNNEDGNYSYGKNPRKLCLKHPTESTMFIELEQSNKGKFTKKLLESNSTQAPALSDDSLTVLKTWLASRYSRSAFPDAFEERLKRNKKLDKLQDTLKKFGQDILAIYTDLYDGITTEKAACDPYLLKIYLVYDAAGAKKTRERCEEAAKKIREAFQGFDPDAMNQICLEDCKVVADTDFSLAMIRQLHRWRADFICFTPKVNQPKDVVSAL